MLSRMKELAVQASSGTYSNTDRAALNLEFGQAADRRCSGLLATPSGTDSISLMVLLVGLQVQPLTFR
jgi:hypothetical protein